MSTDSPEPTATAVTDGFLSSIMGDQKKKNVSKAKPPDTVKSVKSVTLPQNGESGEWHVRQGSALIVNIMTFSDSLYQNRRGSDRDRKQLRAVLTSLGFSVEYVNNRSRDNVVKQIEAFAAARDSACDECVLVAVMTHGEAGGALLASDGKTFTTKDVWRPFVENPRIADTPKIFIFQACRGRYKDVGTPVQQSRPQKVVGRVQDEAGPSEADTALAKVASTAEVEVHLPNVPNVLMAYSTIEDYVSWRSAEDGAHYVRVLCDALRSEATASYPRGLVATLTRTHRALSSEEPRMRTQDKGSPWKTYKQGATFTSYLQYKLFLHSVQNQVVTSKVKGKKEKDVVQ